MFSFFSQDGSGALAAKLITGVAALGLLAGGCGADDVSTNGRASTQQVNAVCLANHRKASSEVLKAYDNPRLKRASSERQAVNLEVRLFMPILVANAEAQARAIRDFALPGADKDQIKAILDAYRLWIDRAERNPLEVVTANDVYNEARELAGRYGFVKCDASPFERS